MANRFAWIAAVTVGLLGGGFVFHFPGSYGEASLSGGAAVFGFIIGAINGLLVGFLVWMALRLARPEGGRVLIAMALIVGGTHAFNDGSSTQMPFVLVQLVAGLLAAGTAAWILREGTPASLVIGMTWTLGLAIAGWSGDAIGLPFSETPLGWAQDHGWDGLVTGLVWGTATAVIGLPDVLRRHRGLEWARE